MHRRAHRSGRYVRAGAMAQFWRTASFQIFDGQEMILPKTGRVYQSKSETVSDFSALDHSDGHGIMRLEGVVTGTCFYLLLLTRQRRPQCVIPIG